MSALDDLLTLADAAQLLGVSPATLKHQVHAGKLKARKLGKTWLTTRPEVERYRETHLGRPGRPRKG